MIEETEEEVERGIEEEDQGAEAPISLGAEALDLVLEEREEEEETKTERGDHLDPIATERRDLTVLIEEEGERIAEV